MIGTLIFAAALACREVKLPEIELLELCERTRYSASFHRCTFATEAVTQKVNAYIERRLREEMEYPAKSTNDDSDCGEEGAHLSTTEGWCGEPYVIGNVASYDCALSWTGGAHPDGTPFAINLRVDDAILRDLELRDVVVDVAAEARFWNAVRRNLREQVDDLDEFASEEKIPTADREARGFHFTAEGVVIDYDHYTFGYAVMDATIPYSDLAGILRPELLPKRAH